MKALPSKNVLIMAHTQSGAQYQFREYEKGKWEMLRDGDKNQSAQFPSGEWLKLHLLPVIEMGQPIAIWLQNGKRVTTTMVTFVGRNN
jgi:hypothetical protein